MTKYSKNKHLAIVAIITISLTFGLPNAFAEDTTYKVADDIHTVLTFTFKDGVEKIEFPVFNMENDFIEKNASPSFSVEGVVGPYPYLHRALDEAFKYKANPSYEYDYQLFEVDVAFIKNDETIKTLSYNDCKIENYKVGTLNDSYESYTSSSSGFAIIDDIEFQCSGLDSLSKRSDSTWKKEFSTIEHPPTSYKFAENVRTFITFEFDEGIEKIEFPVFSLDSGFKENTGNTIPSFSVEGTVSEHPLLDDAIEKSRSVSGQNWGFNTDFEANVEFTQDSEVLRTLNFKDCHVYSAKIMTQSDKEEGFTGKSGFASVEQIGFECIGLSTTNGVYDKLKESTLRGNMMKSIVSSTAFPLGTGPKAIVTFTTDNSVEVINFPFFEQSDVISFKNTQGEYKGNKLPVDDRRRFSSIPSTPTFSLSGLVANTPILYSLIDENLALTRNTGSTNFLEDFDVDVDLFDGDKSIRGFNYVDCRVVDYIAKTQTNKEETYFKAFANSNSIKFECQGYHPNNPLYDEMFSFEKAKTTSTNDLRDTSQWGPDFIAKR